MAQSFMDRHAFLMRRLHSLTGVAPIGVFLIFHLTTNASVVWGMAKGDKYGVHAGAYTFQHEVDFIHSMPFLLLIEIFGLWIPIAFHSILGAYYATTGRSNLNRYGRANNWRYTLQRLTAWIGLIFVFYHVATLRWGWTFLMPGGTKWDAGYAASTLAAVLRGQYVEAGVPASEPLTWTIGGLIVAVVYMVGMSALVFHLANGLWTAAITWGMTISAKAQRNWGYVCAGIGVALMGAGWAAVIGFMTLDYDEALMAEQKLRDAEVAPEDEQQPAGELVDRPDDADDRGVIPTAGTYESDDHEGAH